MADDKFKLPQSSYEELTKIIKSYGHFNEPADLKDLSRLSSLHPTIVSRNAGFLVAVGVLETGARKVLTAMGRDLARALEHDMPDEIRRGWQTVVTSTDFLSKVLAAIRIRSGMDQQTLEAHVAYSAGQPKKPQFMTGARTVIDILKAAELIREADGKYVSEGTPSPEQVVQPSIAGGGMRAAGGGVALFHGGAAVGRNVQPFRLSSEAPARVVNININITCTPNDLDNLGTKLRQVLQQLEKEESDEDTGQSQ